MKSFQFESILLLSHRDKKARKVQFHPRRTLLLGENHTGKSSLVKSLFIALGATPLGKLEIWDPQTISAVDFKVDGSSFRVIHQNGVRALYNSNRILLAATGVHSKWSVIFAELVGFNLVITEKKGRNPTRADPASYFLPFYIDQDGSWREKWDTFPSMQRFVTPAKDVLNYFSGIKPAEYYELKGEQNLLLKEADTQINELRLLEKARARLSQTLPLGSVNLSELGFENEIQLLTSEASKLNHSQEQLRLKYVRESEIVSSIQQQVEMAQASLRAYVRDKKFLASVENKQELVCPTCGAEHEQSFLHFLGYAEDARILEQLTLTLQNDLNIAKKEQAATNNELKSLRVNYARINEILNKKRGTLRFEEVVESQGVQVAYRAFNAELEKISIELAGWNTKLLIVSERLAQLANKKRAKAIVDEFRSAYALARESLHVPAPIGPINILSRPNRSGSGGPRLLLAYYSALWKICLREGFNEVPVVIDSPNQQDQDTVNLHLVLEFIAESLPTSRQLIVCLTQETEASFDKIHVFNEKYSLLQAESYEEVELEIGQFYRQMNLALLGASALNI